MDWSIKKSKTQVRQIFAGLNKARGRAIGAAVVALLVGIAVSLIATNRVRAASEARSEAGMKE